MDSGMNDGFTIDVVIFLDEDAFTEALITLDLRHLIDYEGKFKLNEQWTATLNFTEEESGDVHSFQFGPILPMPGGFSLSKELPFFFSFMVAIGNKRFLLREMSSFNSRC